MNNEEWARQAGVIPAKAGIHSAKPRKCAGPALDSRFRGDDRRLVMGTNQNDIATRIEAPGW